MEKKIINFISQVNPNAVVKPDTDLLTEGILDSLSILFLIECLESEYGFKIPEEELKAENFITVTAITGMVDRIVLRNIA